LTVHAVVLVVDDHPVVPLALRSLIEGRFPGVRALQASSLRQARVMYHDEPRLAATVLDLRLPDVAGLEGISELRGLRPEVPIVVFTGLDSEPLRRSAAALGAAAKACAVSVSARRKPRQRCRISALMDATRPRKIFRPPS
jgi:DNA-binding NarL/FixJ family response regulator